MVHKQLSIDTAILVCSTRWSKNWLVDLKVHEGRRCRSLAFSERVVRTSPRCYTFCPLERDDPQEEPRVETGESDGACHERLRELFIRLAIQRFRSCFG